MNSPTIQALFIVTLTLIGLGIIAHKHHFKSLNGKTRVAALREIRALLAPSSVSLLLLLQQRAPPNARLVRAFGITNTFVSADIAVHSSFTHQARTLVRHVEGQGWSRFAENALVAVGDCFRAQIKSQGGISFDTTMQNVALHVILTSLFEVPADELNVDDLSIVAKGINDLWRLSKLPDELPSHLLTDVNTRLRRWVPSQPNPIDFIVPAFETMWRVVAITVAFTHNDPVALTVLADFLANPTRTQFGSFEASGSNLPSAEALVTESIRLYPPTRSISRVSTSSKSWFPFWHERPTVVVADVGAVHRDATIWGADADVYHPMRHHSRTSEQTQALLGFGAGRLRCVASGWAPQAAAVIVAAVCGGLANEFEIEEGKEIGGREGWDGWKIRFSREH